MNIKKSCRKGTQGRKMSLLLFIERLLDYGSLLKRRPSTTRPLPSNLYLHCSELPLSTFITCSVERDYSGLIKYGKATSWQLQRAWEQIYAEYSEKTGGNSYKLLVNLSRDIGYLENKRFCIAICLKVLQHRPELRCMKILRDYGYKYNFDITDPAKYADDIAAIATRTGSLTLAIDQKKAEIEKSTRGLNGKEVTRDHFDLMIASISKYMQRHIDRDVTTVAEFISYRKLYEKEIESMQKVKEKNTYQPKGIKHIGRGR